eukprot:TRINITY_DN19173_c0_g1_i1.p1 TRINITY_DN19173_c0_g1~~TRINITY_DN19173_c0_g1_i1.p1  ORF type:complete len:504 (+),score=57.66 TRINITY_DN19173_c0_g1_i1:168-1679(+)
MSASYKSLLPVVKSSGKTSRWRKALCVCAQFSPYFLMWFGFFLITNDVVAAYCEVELINCVEVGTADFENVTQARDIFECPDLDINGGGIGLVLVLGLILFSVVMAVQFMLLILKIGPTPYESLRFVVWLEAAKEVGSLFNRITRFSAAVIFAGAVFSIADFFRSMEDRSPIDVLNTIFTALTALWTAYQLSTYDSPVTTVYHARSCPDVRIAYNWWEPSEDVILNIHFILALEESIVNDLLAEAGGNETLMEGLLEERNLTHLSAMLLASLGEGEVGHAALRQIRFFFSHPPTRTEYRKLRKEGGPSAFIGASPIDPGVTRPHDISKEMANLKKMAKLESDLEEANDLIKSLKEELSQLEKFKTFSNKSLPPHKVLKEAIEATVSRLVTSQDYFEVVQKLFVLFPTDLELYSLIQDPDRLEEEILRLARSDLPSPSIPSYRESIVSSFQIPRPRTPDGLPPEQHMTPPPITGPVLASGLSAASQHPPPRRQSRTPSKKVSFA